MKADSSLPKGMEYPIYPWDFKTFFGTKFTGLLRRGTQDFDSINSIAVHDEYNFKAIPFNDGDVVLDLGAHIGGASLLLASLNRNLRIHAYEPLPENINLIKRSAKLNGFSNIFAHQLAISHKKEKTKIYYGVATTEIGRIHYFIGRPTGSPSDRYVEVDTTTLEEIFSEHHIERCKLIKSDIERDESSIFKLCPFEILKRIDYFVGEHHVTPRKELLRYTHGLFEDEPYPQDQHQPFPPWWTDTDIGHFWFRNKMVSSAS